MPKFVVRYGAMRELGVLSARNNDRYTRGSRVVVRTNRGMEVGEVLSEATEEAVKQLKDPAHGSIVRQMTSEDENELSHIQSSERQEFETCQKHVQELSLQMDLVDIEHLFGGERIIIYYLAEQRVDFRELVKILASEFQTRIEMRQIGVRDEAKLLADYGDCGKPVCCNTHLSKMPPVSMKMAKLQKATLDPTKISGRCGRLKCCLRYEYDTYEELNKELPPIGSEVVTNNGRARVLGHEILAQQLLVQTEDSRRLLIDGADVVTVLKKGSGRSRDDRGDQEESAQEGSERQDGEENRQGRRSRDRNRNRDARSRSNKDKDKSSNDKENEKKESRGRSRGGKNKGQDRNKQSNDRSAESDDNQTTPDPSSDTDQGQPNEDNET